MPKPTFFQAVLRKPTRSYADPYYVPPWSDNYDYDYEQEQEQYSRPASRYSARMDEGVFLGYREGHEPEAGPSKPRKVPKAPRSVISTVSEEGGPSTPKTRFPKAARRVASSVVVRGGHVVEIVDERDNVPSRSSTVKKKKSTARSRRGSEDAETIMTVSRPNTPAASVRSTRRVRRTEPDYDDELDGQSVVSVSRSTNRTPSLQSRNRLQPSESSSSSVPVSLRNDQPSVKRQSTLRANSALQKDVSNGKTPPTPPDSLRSSRDSPLQDKRQPQSVQPRRLQPQSSSSPAEETRSMSRMDGRQGKRVSVVQEETDGEDNFFTPRQSMDVRPMSAANIPMIIPPPSDAVLMPTVNVQPPTPAPLEVDASPFHSEPSSTSSSLHPNQTVAPINPQPYFDSTSAPSKREEDAHTEASEAGSDEEAVAERKRPKSRADSSQNRPPSFSGRQTPIRIPSRPPSVAQSVPAGSVNGDARPRRPSENVHGPDFKRRYSTPLSEQSFGARSAQSGKEGSIRSSVSGFGKGGWAAAAAASTARSGASSPVMYMPSGGDGWASFHVPPRQSKFTPLPSASQPMTFDRLVRDHPIAASAPASRMGDRPEPLRGAVPTQSAKSSVSSYSQAVEEDAESSSEEEDDLPLPSRSYARAIPDSPSDHTPSNGQTPVDSANSSHSRLSSTSIPPVPPPKNPSRGLMAQLSQYGSASSLQEPDVEEGQQLVPRTNAVYTQRNGHISDGNGSLRDANGLPQLAPPLSTADFVEYSPDQSQEPTPYSSRHSSPTATRPTSPSLSRPNTPGARAFDTPSFLNPDVLTILPEMTAEDSARLYQSAASETGRSKRASWNDHSNRSIKRSASLWAGRARSVKSEVGREEDENDHLEELPRRSQSVMGFRKSVSGSKWGGSSYGDGQIMGSDGIAESVSGYTNLILPSGAYTPIKASKSPNTIDPKVLGLPHATMAAITLSTSAHRLPMTPMHLRTNLPPPVDFSSHLKPPAKTGDGQLLVQVYAAAVDPVDVEALEEKGLRDVGKWVPGRSFVGRCLMVGAAEKDIVRGDIVIGLLDIRKSGALAEYILVDRRRVARAPYPTGLTLEQLALLPLEGIAATRAIRTHLVRHSRALVMDAHTSVGALICQELSRAGVYVVGLIGGGENHHEAQTACMRNGAKGVMTGSPAAVMNGMDEWAWDFVLDTVGGPRVYEAAKRILKDQATLVSTVSPEPSMPASAAKPKASGFKAFRNAFRSRKKDQKYIAYEYLPPSASGEAEVDSSGMDCRDILEEPCMSTYKPEVRYVYPLERGMEAFVSPPETSVVRLIN